MKIISMLITIFVLLSIVIYSSFNEFYIKPILKNASKSNYYSILNFIKTEIDKCRSGHMKAMSGKLSCSEITASTIATSAVSIFSDFRNPYSTANNALTNDGNNTADNDVGYIRLITFKNEIILKTCFDTPCEKKKNQIQGIIKLNN